MEKANRVNNANKAIIPQFFEQGQQVKQGEQGKQGKQCYHRAACWTRQTRGGFGIGANLPGGFAFGDQSVHPGFYQTQVA